MSKHLFKIRPGIYTVPEIGIVNTKKPLSNQMLIDLALSSAFPFIEITQESVTVLKKGKITSKEVVKLMGQAKTAQQIDWLLEVKSNKTIENIAATIKKKFV